MRVGSLFTGIGGFDLAFERAGMTTAWQVEIDARCREVLAKQFPHAERYDDVRTVGKHNLAAVDVLCGGFPCQDLSVAGKRAGLDGERSGLWFEFARIIEELAPEWVVIENVPGLLSSNRGRDFAVILQGLVKLGYGVAWRVLNAQYFGVPQRRRRVFIVGHLGDGRAAEVLFEREGGGGNTAQGGEARKDVASTLAGGSDKCHSDITSGQQDGNLIARCDTSREGQRNDGETETFITATPQSGGSGGIPSSRGEHLVNIANWGCSGNTMEDDVAATLRSGAETNYQFLWEMQHASEAYRPAKGGGDPALQARMGTGGNNVPMTGVRRLTPTECARLQGFPDDWNDWLSDAQRYRQFGNAVAVPVVEWIGRRICRCDGHIE